MKNTEEIVYNTLGDIHDTPWKGFSRGQNGEIEEFVENPNTIIKSLNGLFIGNKRYGIQEEEGGGEFEEIPLRGFIDKLPHGIFDKKVAGIGATTIEIKSNRHSILVMPTKFLAYNKAQKHDNTIYVGSGMNGESSNKYFEDLEQNIISYIINPKIEYKKFLVVADSLGRLIDILIKTHKCDIYNHFFLMVDEIDLLQDDSNYRPNLESVIDFYFRFNVKNRCLVSATMRDFTHPLLAKECVFNLDNLFKKKRNIDLIHTDNINKVVSDVIKEKSKDEKILIAYNSITEIRNIISLLDDDLKKECAVLCSDTSKNDVTNYYAELNNNTLPNRIVFITCCYFAGIDIEDKYHLITVSNPKKPYMILSPNKMIQIHGRCRKENGILSDTIVYSLTKGLPYKGKIKDYEKLLIKKAKKVIALYNSADNLCKDNKELINLFDIVKEAIQKNALEKGNPLTRKNIDKEYVPAYLNIDYLIERKELESGLYHYEKELKSIMEKENTLNSFNRRLVKKDDKQKELEESNKEEFAELYDKTIEGLIIQIKELEKTGELSDSNIKKLIRKNKKIAKSFCERFLILYHFINIDMLMQELWTIRNDDNRAFKNLNNTIMLWALEENHPLRLSFKEEFNVGNEYSSIEIYEKITNIFDYHFHGIAIKSRLSVTFLKSFFNTHRTTDNKYLITEENGFANEFHKDRISSTENNLRKYFKF